MNLCGDWNVNGIDKVFGEAVHSIVFLSDDIAQPFWVTYQLLDSCLNQVVGLTTLRC